MNTFFKLLFLLPLLFKHLSASNTLSDEKLHAVLGVITSFIVSSTKSIQPTIANLPKMTTQNNGSVPIVLMNKK